MCSDRWYHLQSSSYCDVHTPFYYLLPDWISSQFALLPPNSLSIWPGAFFRCVRIYSKPLSKPYRSTHLLLNSKLESSSLAVQTPLETGGEDFCGHYKHRKRVTVWVRSSSIGAFLWDLDGCQPPLVLANSRKAWKVTRVFFLADTSWIMIYDGGGWVLNVHFYL